MGRMGQPPLPRPQQFETPSELRAFSKFAPDIGTLGAEINSSLWGRTSTIRAGRNPSDSCSRPG